MSNELIPAEYQHFLQTIKTRIQQAQLQALSAVNRELILLYWHIGRSILERQKEQGWGSKVIDRLAADLHHAFPEMRGFSVRNLKYMRTFAEAYPSEQIVQTVSAQIPWSHNIALLDKVKDQQERLWYLQQTVEHGWSVAVLEAQIETGLLQRRGKALTNFKETLPALQSDLADEVLKDPQKSKPQSHSSLLTPYRVHCRYAHIEACDTSCFRSDSNPCIKENTRGWLFQ
jgi:predicted nuclease of restriction endonuclease-like (RecB) superfamily